MNGCTRSWWWGTVLALAAWAAAGEQLDSSTYFKIRRGMTESEVLLRAGTPDLVTHPGTVVRERTIGGASVNDAGEASFIRFRRTDVPEVKQLHYIPDKSEHDPFLTIVTLRGGLVWSLERTKVFDRTNLPEPPVADEDGAPERLSDTEIRRQQAESTLQAARDYAATRERLLEQAASGDAGAAPGSPRIVYRDVNPAGSTYYGDRPPGVGSTRGPVDEAAEE